MRSKWMIACLGLVLLAGCKNKKDEYCRQAYTEMNAAMAGTGMAQPQDAFMTSCRALSETAAHCMVMSYAQAHASECASARH